MATHNNNRHIYVHGRCLLITIVFTLLTPHFIHAQTIISPEKVKTSFLSGGDSTILMDYDKMYRDEKVNFHEFFAKNTMFRKAGNMYLPPSEWGLCYGNDQKGYIFSNHYVPYVEEGEQCFLCWMGLKDDSLGKENFLWKKLKKKYGCMKERNGKMEGIPATWLSGEITLLTYVRIYGGTYTCTAPDTCRIEQGKLLLGLFPEWKKHWHESYNPWNYFDKINHKSESQNNLYLQISDMAPDLFRTLGSRENYHRIQWAEMLLLAYEANKHCPTSFNGYHTIKDLPIYVYMRKDGRCEMLVLDDSKLKEEDIPYVEELANALPQMPPMLISLQFTIDGEMMPGKILYASHDGAWSFREVNQER